LRKKILAAFGSLSIVFLISVILISENPEIELPSRADRIPTEAVKGSPENDNFPPILHSDEYEEPIPLSEINTAGAEDSPFIPVDRDEIYFFFVPDVSLPVEEQALDIVTGIWVSKRVNSVWGEPKRVLLQERDKLALDGCEFVKNDEIMFCSAREGFTGVHWFIAEFKDGEWKNWYNADFNPDHNVGELHIHGDELFYHSDRIGGKGRLDIWMLTLVDGEWKNPVNIEAVNSDSNEGWPFITSNGEELWFNREYMGSPAIFKSKKINGVWQEPELIISQFAGEPTMDRDGNVYFVHHFFEDGQMIEADIYVAYRK
jgi:hypothetical protein